MWHSNNPDTSKPEGRVLVRTRNDVVHAAEWNGEAWQVAGLDACPDQWFVYWTEIPPFDDGEGE